MGFFSSSRRGNAVRFFFLCFFCVWFGVSCRLLPFFPFRVVVRERTFVLWCRCWSCVFWCCFAYVLALFFVFRSRNCLEKILLMSGLVFWGFFSPFLWFSCRRCRPFCFCFFFFLRETAQVVTGHTPTRILCFCPFFLSLSPPQLAVPPFFLAFLSGCHSGPRAFWRLLGFSRDLGGGLEITRPPSDAFFSDASRQGCFVASRACLCFSPFCFVLRPRTFSRSPSRLSSSSGHNIG